MRIFKIIFVFFILSLTARAQYPFEKYPSIKDTTFTNWITYDRVDTKSKIDFTLTIPNFFTNNDTLSVQLTAFVGGNDTSLIRIFKNKKQIINFKENFSLGLTPFNKPDSAFVADYNGDSLKDLKIYVPNHGCGGFNYYAQVIYLIQKPNKNFIIYSYVDLFEGFIFRKERDIDGDGIYEIITQTFQNYKTHNYWLFNIYKIQNDNFVNVNFIDNYPIMIQILWKGNSEITKNLTRDKMKEFSRKLPDE